MLTHTTGVELRMRACAPIVAAVIHLKRWITRLPRAVSASYTRPWRCGRLRRATRDIGRLIGFYRTILHIEPPFLVFFFFGPWRLFTEVLAKLLSLERRADSSRYFLYFFCFEVRDKSDSRQSAHVCSSGREEHAPRAPRARYCCSW